WFNHLEVTLQKLCYALKETGWLTFSTFGERTFHELYTSYEQALSKLNIQKRTRLGQSFYSSQHLKKVCQSGHNELPVEVEVAEAEITKSFPSAKAFFKLLKKIEPNKINQEANRHQPPLFNQLIPFNETKNSKDAVIQLRIIVYLQPYARKKWPT